MGASFDGNNTANYAASVAGNLGLDRNTRLDLSNPRMRQAVASTMSMFENGTGARGRSFARGRPRPANRPADAIAAAFQGFATSYSSNGRVGSLQKRLCARRPVSAGPRRGCRELLPDRRTTAAGHGSRNARIVCDEFHHHMCDGNAPRRRLVAVTRHRGQFADQHLRPGNEADRADHGLRLSSRPRYS